MTETQDWQDERLQVVLNQDDPYSVWPAERTPPADWLKDGKVGLRDGCLTDFVNAWTKTRALSSRR
jgi:MbtH protein